MNYLSKALPALLLAFVALPACGAQKDNAYQGDTLVSVHGNIIVAGQAAPDSVRVALVWNNFAQNGDTSTVQDVTVQGSFPAKFQLDLLNPPPAEAFNDFSLHGHFPSEVPVAVGAILAVRPSADVAHLKDEDLAGLVENQVLVYVDRDVLPDTQAAQFVGGALPKGFHMMNVVRFTPEQKTAKKALYAQCSKDNVLLDPHAMSVACGNDGTFDELHEAPTGFATEVTLRLAPEDQLDEPNVN